MLSRKRGRHHEARLVALSGMISIDFGISNGRRSFFSPLEEDTLCIHVLSLQRRRWCEPPTKWSNERRRLRCGPVVQTLVLVKGPGALSEFRSGLRMSIIHVVIDQRVHC